MRWKRSHPQPRAATDDIFAYPRGRKVSCRAAVSQYFVASEPFVKMGNQVNVDSGKLVGHRAGATFIEAREKHLKRCNACEYLAWRDGTRKICIPFLYECITV